MTGRVEGKMSFVTGAAQGLGEAIAYMLAKEGSKVVLADINEEKLNEIKANHHGRASSRATRTRATIVCRPSTPGRQAEQ